VAQLQPALDEQLGFLIAQCVNGVSAINPEPAMTTKPTNLHAYLQGLPIILDKIEALRQLTNDHFGHHPDAIHWGHVGDPGRVEAALGDLLAIFDGRAK
jgi:hypothetical protein